MLPLAATKRPDSLGGYDLYVSHKQADGKWSEPVNLGPEINSPERELSPKLTPDGKYLIWTSCRLVSLAAKPPKRTTDQMFHDLQEPVNEIGVNYMYVVSAEVT